MLPSLLVLRQNTGPDRLILPALLVHLLFVLDSFLGNINFKAMAGIPVPTALRGRFVPLPPRISPQSGYTANDRPLLTPGVYTVSAKVTSDQVVKSSRNSEIGDAFLFVRFSE